MKVESGTVNKPSVQKPSTGKKTEKTQNKTDPSNQSKTSSQSAPSNQIKVEDKVQLSDKAQEKLKSEKKEEKSVFQSAYDWITGQGEDSSKLIDEQKQKEFQEKLKKEDPERYKQYMRNQFDADQKIIDAKEKAGDAAQEGLERATDVDTLVKSGITGADEYALKKQNKEAEEKQMELAKNKDSNKDHVSSLLNSQGEINRANLEVADATQNIADTIDPTLGGAGKLVDAKNKFKSGDYKGAALDTGEAGLRVVTSALLESGKAFEWAGKAGNKVLKLAGPGAKKIFSKGDDILKSVSPEAYKALTESGGTAKKIVSETLEKGGELVNKSLKSVTGKEAKEILEWANRPVKEIASEAGEGIKKKIKGFVDKSGGKVDEMIEGGKDLKKSLGEVFEDREIDIKDMTFKEQMESSTKIKDFNQIIADTEKKYKPKELKLTGDKKIRFYGEDDEAALIQKSLDMLPEKMKEKLLSGDGKELKIYVDDYLYSGSDGISPGNLGLCCPSEGKIVLNRSNLNRDLNLGYIYEKKHFRSYLKNSDMERWQIPGYDNRNTFNDYMAGLVDSKSAVGNKSIIGKDSPADILSSGDVKVKPEVDTTKIPVTETPPAGSNLESPRIKQEKLLNKSKDKYLDTSKDTSGWDKLKKSQEEVKPRPGDNLDILKMDSVPEDSSNISKVGFKDGEVKKQLKWQETFFHEIFHQYDYNMGKGGYLSEIAEDTPWGKDPAMHNITNYTKKVQKASETAAESFTQLMNHVQDYTVINKGNFDMKDFMSYIEGDTYLGSYKYIIDNYLDGTLF